MYLHNYFHNLDDVSFEVNNNYLLASLETYVYSPPHRKNTYFHTFSYANV